MDYILLFLTVLLSAVASLAIISYYLKSIDSKIENKVFHKFKEKEKVLEDKIKSIEDFKKYLNFNIGDLVLFKIDMSQGKGDKKISFTAYFESEIIDISSKSCKIKALSANLTSNVPDNQACIDYINTTNCWVESWQLERRLSKSDYRDIKLNKILE